MRKGPPTFGPTDPQIGLFRDLGFRQPAPITELLVDDGGYSGTISDERIELLDAASVVVWNGGPEVPEELAQNPLYPRLKLVREGRELFVTDDVLDGALRFGSPLSLPYALDRIVPMLAAALDGDPATKPPS